MRAVPDGRVFGLLSQALILLALCCTGFAAPASSHSRLILKARDHSSEARLNLRLSTRGELKQRPLAMPYFRVVTAPEARVDALIAELESDSDVEFIERDGLAKAAFVPNDPWLVSGKQWHLARVQAPLAWNVSVGNVTVAILDSGVNRTHPDLASRVLPGYDFLENDNDPSDDNGHGTAVAGVVAAAGNNGIGVAGLAFGCSILPVKIADSAGIAAYSDIASGIKYAVDRGARVINISMAGDSSSKTLQNAIDYAWAKNVLVVAAAGNNSSATPLYPAACEHVTAVSATDLYDTMAAFSSFGAHIKVSAPGENIWTTQQDPFQLYGSWRGTSFASPVVAGIAALALSVSPRLTPADVAAILQNTAEDKGAPGPDILFGYGRVNAYAAVRQALAASGRPLPAEVNLATPLPASVYELEQTIPLLAYAAVLTGSVARVSFLANGFPIAELNSSPFATNWIPQAFGSFDLQAVAWTAAGLVSTSAPVRITVLGPDTNAPLIAFTSAPVNGARRTSPGLVLRGLAHDNRALDRVEMQLNSSPYVPAEGTTNWTVAVSLTPGTNTVRIRGVDAAGNVSRPLNRSVFFSVPAPLRIETNGIGQVTPDLAGRSLEIGRAYVITAIPGTNQAFAGWDGATPEKRALRFTMQSNLVLVANFVPSPFPAVRGSYGGLVADTNGVMPSSSGYLGLAVTRSGNFTGALRQNSASYSFSGKFNLSGNASVRISRWPKTPVHLALALDLTPEAGSLCGTATEGSWVSALIADRKMFNAITNPAPQAGLHKFYLTYATDSGISNAAVASARIYKSGATATVGRYADGRAFTAGTFVAANDETPLYVPTRRGAEVMIGWLSFPAATLDVAAGTLVWVNTTTNGFVRSISATPRE